jgi:hypothetical protein
MIIPPRDDRKRPIADISFSSLRFDIGCFVCTIPGSHHSYSYSIFLKEPHNQTEILGLAAFSQTHYRQNPAAQILQVEKMADAK